MARAVVLPPIDRDFAKEVSALAKEGQKLIDGYARLTEQMLVFAEDFKRLSQQMEYEYGRRAKTQKVFCFIQNCAGVVCEAPTYNAARWTAEKTVCMPSNLTMNAYRLSLTVDCLSR
jgi:hypothetical protein